MPSEHIQICWSPHAHQLHPSRAAGTSTSSPAARKGCPLAGLRMWRARGAVFVRQYGEAVAARRVWLGNPRFRVCLVVLWTVEN